MCNRRDVGRACHVLPGEFRMCVHLLLLERVNSKKKPRTPSQTGQIYTPTTTPKFQRLHAKHTRHAVCPVRSDGKARSIRSLRTPAGGGSVPVAPPRPRGSLQCVRGATVSVKGKTLRAALLCVPSPRCPEQGWVRSEHFVSDGHTGLVERCHAGRGAFPFYAVLLL